MNDLMRRRMVLALVGAAAGASLYALGQLLDGDLLGDRVALALATLAVTFFFGLLGMAGPLPVARAALGAAGVAGVVTVLLSLAGLRFQEIDGLANAPIPAAAAFVLATVPLPFFIAACGPGWRDYPTLFSQAWGIFVRYSVAWGFVAVVWGVVLLSDALFGVVGLTVIEDVLRIDIVPWVITGTVLGLALTVVQDMSDVVTPYLVLRLLRLLVPVVLVVTAVFIAALPFHGLSKLFGGLSVAATLLAMTAAAATLVTSAVDQEDLGATEPALMRWATQGLAVLLLVPAVLGAMAVWWRVGQYGWTPERLFAASVAAIAVGYGALYALAVLRGAGWMARIRQANTAMAVVLIGVAALWLTPLLNPEAISTRSQIARLQDGRTAPGAFDVHALDQWGKAGQAGRDRLAQLAATEAGYADLGQALADPSPGFTFQPAEDTTPLRAALIAVLPLQPAGATATRDLLLGAADAYELRDWTAACTVPLPQGGPGCVMVIADLMPGQPGEEAIMVTVNAAGGFARFDGLSLRDGLLVRHALWATDGQPLPGFDEAATLIAALQAAPASLSLAPLNQINVPSGPGLALVP